MEQLKADIKELFADSEEIKKYYGEYDGEEFEDILVKEAYESFPNISYPNIIIQEINNLPANRYWNGKEFATSLTYQFTINCEQTANHTANEAVTLIQTIINKYMQDSKYNCLRRAGFSGPKPTVEDVNIRCGFLRYDCNLVASQNTIYRRY